VLSWVKGTWLAKDKFFGARITPQRPPDAIRSSTVMRDLDTVFAKLAGSPFRAKFRLGPKDRGYLDDRGMAVVLEHARDLIAKRLAPEAPLNDGKQTPWRGHPVFVAQHATGTCCRSCLAKWHGIPAGRELSREEQAHVVSTIERWLTIELERRS
jgi:hypothetical protein